MPDQNRDTPELNALAKWMGGLIMSGAIAWATWTTTGLQETKNNLFGLSERLARIEAKIDYILDKK